MPRKPVSENVVCLCRPLNILANFSNLFFAYRQTVWTLIRLLLEDQSDLGPHYLQKILLKSQADGKADDNCYDCGLRVKCVYVALGWAVGRVERFEWTHLSHITFLSFSFFLYFIYRFCFSLSCFKLKITCYTVEWYQSLNRAFS